MEAQRQPVQMGKQLRRQLAHRVHRHLGEEPVTHLREQRHGDTCHAVEDREQDRRSPQPVHSLVGRHPRAVRGFRDGDKCIRRPFVGEGHHHRGEFGQNEQAKGQEDAIPEIRTPVRPEIGPQANEGSVEAGLAGRWRRRRFRLWGVHMTFRRDTPPGYGGLTGRCHPAHIHFSGIPY